MVIQSPTCQLIIHGCCLFDLLFQLLFNSLDVFHLSEFVLLFAQLSTQIVCLCIRIHIFNLQIGQELLSLFDGILHRHDSTRVIVVILKFIP